MKIFICLTLLTFIFLVKETKGKPFLFSTTKWLYEKFVTNSSMPDHSTRNIEDLSEEGPIFHHNKYAKDNIAKIRKAHLMEDHSGGTTPKSMDDKIHFDMDDKDNIDSLSETPGILHRKISKILNKLQLYSAVRSTIHNVRRQQNGGNAENTEMSDDLVDKNLMKVIPLMNNTNDSYLPPANTTKRESNNIKEIADNLQEGDEFDERYDEPFVFDDELDAKKKMDDRKDDIDSNTNINNNKLSLETGNLGIHVMEILGSIVTIFLSAAYQVGNYASSLTQGTQNQAIPTSQPIEGMPTTLKWKIN